MRYITRFLITTDIGIPFFTDYFDVENNFTEGIVMMVFDLPNARYYNGEQWYDCEIDHL